MNKIIQGEAWVDEKFAGVTFIKAKECNNDVDNFIKVLQEDDPDITIDSRVLSTYLKFNVGYSPEFGNGFWEGGHKKGEKGAAEFYYAITKMKDID